ncbi:MAG: hypothetical protein RLY83_863 [Actinomycetota bacterium]
MQSSNLYTFQKPIGGKRKFLKSTIVLSVLSLVGAIGIDYALNPKAVAAMFSSNASTGNSTDGSATGDAIDYEFGTVQLKVTKTSGKVSAIDLVQAGATAGREQAFSMLVEAAISANGSSITNISGATYTTDAFKQALDSALSKLG